MSGFLCSMVGASFTVAAAAQVLRSKKGITAVGNAQVDTAQSKFGGASALFDGTGDYLFSPSNSDFGFGTGDFTLEGWFRFVNFTNGPALFDLRAAGGTEVKPLIYCGSDGVLYYYVNGAARITGSALSATTWYHITVSRASGSTKMFVNGTQVGSTYSDSNNYGTTVVSIGIASWNTAFNAFNGHADEIRVSNSARYTTTFTPSTSPFVNDANTLLLIHANGTDAATFFEDDNGSRASTGLIATGAAKVSTTQSKFGGSSANFDGSSNTQVLVRSWNTSSYTGDFTIEGWFYITDKTTSTNARVWSDGDGGTTEDFRLLQFEYSTNQIYLVTGQSGNDSWNYSYVSATLNINTWYHIAASRTGSSLRIFVNGTQQGSTISNSLAFTTASSNHSGRLGMFRTDASRYRGFIDDFRISNSARYTTTFTPTTTPFVNDTNTLLLIHGDGTNNSTVVRDDNGATPPTTPVYNSDAYSSFLKLAVPFASTVNDIGFNINTSLGSAATVTQGSSSTISGGGAFSGYDNSLLNSRAGSALTYAIPGGIPTSASGSYVVEGWFAATDATTNSNWVLSSADSGGRWLLGLNTGSTSQYASENWQGIGTGWNHCAIVCDAGTKRFYVNGVYKGAFSTSNTGFSTLHVGQFNAGDANDYIGRIQDLRVYVGTNKGYTGTNSSTANFALPGPIQGARTQKGIQAVGNAQVDTAQSQFGGASLLLDGTGDFLQLRNLPDLGTNNFTIECWARPNSISGIYDAIFTFRHEQDFDVLLDGSTKAPGIVLSTGSMHYYAVDGTSGAVATYSSSLATGSWQHIALVRNSSNLSVYINGTSVTSVSSTASYNNLGTSSAIGIFDRYIFSGGRLWFNGHIDEFRISNTARYTAAFTPSTTPFQNDANTLLLLHMNGTDASTAFFDDNGIAPYTP